MKRSRPPVLYLPGIKSLAEFDFDGRADEKVIRKAASEQQKWRERQFKKLTRMANEDRQWLKRQAALEAWERQTAIEDAATELYLKNLRTALHLELEKQYLAREWARVKKAAEEINRDICRAERKELLKHGAIRGVRSKAATV